MKIKNENKKKGNIKKKKDCHNWIACKILEICCRKETIQMVLKSKYFG